MKILILEPVSALIFCCWPSSFFLPASRVEPGYPCCLWLMLLCLLLPASPVCHSHQVGCRAGSEVETRKIVMQFSLTPACLVLYIDHLVLPVWFLGKMHAESSFLLHSCVSNWKSKSTSVTRWTGFSKSCNSHELCEAQSLYLYILFLDYSCLYLFVEVWSTVCTSLMCYFWWSLHCSTSLK